MIKWLKLLMTKRRYYYVSYNFIKNSMSGFGRILFSSIGKLDIFFAEDWLKDKNSFNHVVITNVIRISKKDWDKDNDKGSKAKMPKEEQLCVLKKPVNGWNVGHLVEVTKNLGNGKYKAWNTVKEVYGTVKLEDLLYKEEGA